MIVYFITYEVSASGRVIKKASSNVERQESIKSNEGLLVLIDELQKDCAKHENTTTDNIFISNISRL
jgi:hypothetical protein